mgnify:FL=1
MPRKPCDNVNEFRITLGDFERKKIQEIITTQQANVAVDGVTAVAQAVGTAIGGLGVYALGAAALLYVGFSFDETVDNISTRFTTWLEKSGFVNYHADEYGRELAKVYEELQTLSDESLALDPTNPVDRNRHQAIMTRVALLTKRQDALEAVINAIAAGDEDGWNTRGRAGGHASALNERYTDWYTRTHGHAPAEVPEWDIR